MYRSVVLVVAVVASLVGLRGAVAAPSSNASTAPAVVGGEGVPRFGHVFVIVGENTSLTELDAVHAPYIVGQLKPRGAWLTDYHALHSGSLSDYVGMTSGQYQRCDVNDDQPHPPGGNCHQNIDNLFSQLDAKGISWVDRKSVV